MKRKIFSGFLAALFCILLTGCHMNHEWQEATCMQPMTCSVGGETKGEASGHKWIVATCTEPKTCSVCKETEGEALGHTITEEATCGKAAVCSTCGVNVGEPLEHTWLEATCTQPKTCSICNETEGEMAGHQWEQVECMKPLICSVCQLTADAPGHSWEEATCTAPKTCLVCQLTEGEALGHKTEDTDICIRCGEVVKTAQSKISAGDSASVQEPADNAASDTTETGTAKKYSNAEIPEWIKNPEFNTLERMIGYQLASPEEQAVYREMWDQYWDEYYGR